MVTEALSQLGLPVPSIATASIEPWLVLLSCAIIWLALSGGSSSRRNNTLFRA